MSLQSFAATFNDTVKSKIEDITQKTGSKKEIISLLKQAYKEYELTNKDIALEYAAHALQIATELNATDDIAEISDFIGNIHFQNEFYYMAIKYYTVAYKIYISKNNKIAIANCWVNFGNIFLKQELSDAATDYYKRAFQVFDSLNNAKGKAMVNEKYGLVAQNQDNDDLALKYFFKATNDYHVSNDSMSLANIYTEIANSFQKLEQIKQSDRYLKSALNIYVTLKKNTFIADMYFNLGDFKLKCRDYREAEKYFYLSLKMFTEQRRQIRICDTYNKLAYVYESLNEPTKGIYFAKLSLDSSKMQEFYNQKREAYNMLSNLYTGLHNTPEALSFLRKYSAIKDSIFERKKHEQFSDMLVTLESQKQDYMLENLRIANEAKIIAKEKQLNIIFIAFVLLLIISVFIYYLYSAKKEANQLLIEKNKHINDQKNEIEQNIEQLTINEHNLRIANQTKDKMFSIIGHDLRNPIGAMKEMFNLLVDDYHNYTKEQLLEIITMMKDNTALTFNLLENLLYWAKSQMGDICPNPEMVDLQKIIQESIDLMSINKKCTTMKFETKFDGQSIAYTDKNAIHTIFRNLLTNAVKYTAEGGIIKIDVTHFNQFVGSKSKPFIQVSISDNGLGIKPENLSKLFDRNVQFTTYGTNREKGSGLGLLICKEFVELGGGKIWVESKEEKGSTFSFTLPATGE